MRVMTFIEVDIRHRMTPLRMLYSTTLTYIFIVKNVKCNYLRKDESQRKRCIVFYRFEYFLSNGTVAEVVLHNFYLHFQGQTFSCYVFAIKIVQSRWMSPQISFYSYSLLFLTPYTVSVQCRGLCLRVEITFHIYSIQFTKCRTKHVTTIFFCNNFFFRRQTSNKVELVFYCREMPRRLCEPNRRKIDNKNMIYLQTTGSCCCTYVL